MSRYYIDYSLKNGLSHPAISIYLTGCDNPIKCEDCHNWELQDEVKDNYDINIIKNELDCSIRNFLCFHKTLYISILGGEPLAEYNKNITLQLSKYIKNKYNNAIIVLYSWKDINQINKEDLNDYIKYIDYGVLGPYKKELYIPNTLPSSTNQYIYNFQKNIKLNSIQIKEG